MDLLTKTKEELIIEINSLKHQLLKAKELEKELSQQKNKYRSAISALSEGIVIQDLDGSIIECNPAAGKILGLTQDQMLGKTSMDPSWRSIYEDGSDFPGETHPAMVTLKTGKPQNNITMGVHKPTGELTWISINSQPIFDNNNGISAVVASFKDITLLKRNEDNLKIQINEHLQERDRHQYLLKTLASEAPIVMFSLDTEGVFTLSDGKGLEKLGLRPGQVVGMPVWELYKDYPDIIQQIKSALNGNPVRVTNKIDNIYFDVLYQPVYNKNNELENIVGVATDITERKIAEEVIKINEKKFHEIFDNIFDCIFLINSDGRIVEVNKSVQLTYGYTKDETLQLGLKQLVCLDYHTIYDDFLEKLTVKDAFERETIAVKKDGSLFNAYERGKKVSFGDNTFLLLTVRDISKQKKQEQELIRNTQLNTALIKLYENTHLEEKEFLQLTLDEAVKFSDSKIGYLHFFNEGLEEIQLVNWSTETFKQCTVVYDNHYPLKKAGVWADAVRLKKPVIINDYKNSLKKQGLPEGHFTLKSHLGVPIFEGKKIVGILGVGNKEKDYTNEDVKQLEIYSRSLWEIIKGMRIDNELKKSEEKFRLLFENMNEGFALHEIICDGNEKPVDYKYLEMNPAFEKLTGMKRENSLGKTVRELLPGIENDPVNWIQNYGKVALTGEKITFINYSELLKKYYKVHGFSSKKYQFAVTFSDISDIKERENQIKEAKEFNDLIFENSPIGIIIFKESGECVAANKIAAETLGADNIEQVKDLNYLQIESWKKSGMLDDALETLRTGRNTQRTTNLKTTFDRKVWIDYYFSKFILKGEVHLLHLIKDVTERILAEQQRDRYFNTTQSMLCTASLEGCFLSLNSSWERELGYTNDELKNVPFINFVHPDDVNDTSKEMKKLRDEHEVVNFTNRYRCKDGKYKWLNWVTASYDNVVYASANDITEIKNNEEKLRDTMAELERSNKELEQFAYVSSHDLQEPLRKVKNYTELLEARYNKMLDEQGKKYISIITNGASRMQKLIDDLLFFSRVSTRGKKFEPVNLNTVFKNTLENLELAIYKAKAKIESDNLPTVNADESQMWQLFQNLLSNAIKFRGDEPPKIKIDVLEQKTQWKFSINDNGIGFDMSYADRIFVVFQRLHPQNEYEGTGIGLALCKKIVERHKGRIWVKSKDGEGSSFYFTISKNL